MEIVVRSGVALRESAPLLVQWAWEEENLPTELASLVEAGDFKAKPKQTLLLYPRESLPARRLLLVGLGKRGSASADSVRQAAALAALKARELQLESYSTSLPASDMPTTLLAQVLAEGTLLGLYRFLDYKSNLSPEQTHEVARLELLVEGDTAAVQAGVNVGQAVAAGVKLARDLANAPGNAVTPARLGEVAEELGGRFGFATTVLGKEELQEGGFGGILAVGQGSANPPRFIVMEHGSKTEGTPTICLVGKGITFDTGGISIKPAESMDAMKMDMGGAAAVLGTMHIVGELKLPLHVVGIVCAAENMPSSTAYKPGDIIRTLSGKTIEVLNTDAEGRIVLADGLHYAQRYEPQAIIDLATLTGAVMVALGPHAIGMMGTSQELADRLTRAGEASAERVWQLPLWDEYRDMMKSEIADLKNTGGRYGGAITAGGFLAAFVGDYPWIHLDIAGTAWVESATRPYYSKGATGIGVRLLTQLLQEYAG